MCLCGDPDWGDIGESILHDRPAPVVSLVIGLIDLVGVIPIALPCGSDIAAQGFAVEAFDLAVDGDLAEFIAWAFFDREGDEEIVAVRGQFRDVADKTRKST